MGAASDIGQRLVCAYWVIGVEWKVRFYWTNQRQLDADLLHKRQREIQGQASPLPRTDHAPTVEPLGILLYGGADDVGWVSKPTWAMYNQGAYDADCAAPARAVETAARRHTTPERRTIFTDAKAAIERVATEEPGPGPR